MRNKSVEREREIRLGAQNMTHFVVFQNILTLNLSPSFQSFLHTRRGLISGRDHRAFQGR